MFLLDWLYGIMVFLGLYPKVKEAKILIWGHDEPGKAVVFNWLRGEDPPIFEAPGVEKIKFKAFDAGDHLISPRDWRDYYVNVKVDAVVYLVDLDGDHPIDQMRNELHQYFEDDSLANVPLLILGRGRILDPPWFSKAFKDDLELPTTVADAYRPIEAFKYNISSRVGLRYGFRWVSKNIR